MLIYTLIKIINTVDVVQMVFAEFISKLVTSVFCVLALCASAAAVTNSSLNQVPQVAYQWPIFAAQLSDETLARCSQQSCKLNVLDNSTLEYLFAQHPLKQDVFEALTLSEYELLVSSATLSLGTNQTQLVMEMTTSWRGVPIDDFTANTLVSGELNTSASVLINAWVERVQQENVFDAKRIYGVIGASDYTKQLQLPEKIGEFVFTETALYHDPMQGSISRYVHPDFADAVVDVSVYPVSPFIHKHNAKGFLSSEMENEKSHIQALIQQAKVDDYHISAIIPARFNSVQGELEGLSMEVALQTQIDPIYSTQFLFTQNDKFIKLTGNLPKHMMLTLVEQSIAQISVPEESEFMQLMRQQ
jgi:hypothetical protein